jgi:transcription elongation factor GreA
MQIPYRKPGKFSQMKTDPLITEGKFLELEKKLDRLKNVSRPEAAAEVKRLAELGDFSENAEYQLAKGRLRGINSRILSIEIQLKQAEVIKRNSVGVVEVGSTVTVSDGTSEKTYRILGSTETKPGQGIISHNSPVGKALLGHEVGDEVFVSLAQKVVEYRILKVK